MTAAASKGIELAAAIGSLGGVGVSAGVQLDAGGAQLDGGLDLSGVGVDEKSNVDARVAAAGQRVRDAVALTDDVKTSLGRQFLTAFGHERCLVGLDLKCQGDDAGLDSELHVESDLHGLPQQSQVALLDVAAIFAEMDRDHVAPAQFGQHGRPDRVGLAPTANLTKRGHMIDIDTQARHVRFSPQMNERHRRTVHERFGPPVPRGGDLLARA